MTAAAASETTPENRRTLPAAAAVHGWDHDVPRADSAAPVVVNPLASDAALADWARAQARCTQVLLESLHLHPTPDGVDPEAVAAVGHFQEQAVCALIELARRLSLPAGATG